MTRTDRLSQVGISGSAEAVGQQHIAAVPHRSELLAELEQHLRRAEARIRRIVADEENAHSYPAATHSVAQPAIAPARQSAADELPHASAADRFQTKISRTSRSSSASRGTHRLEAVPVLRPQVEVAGIECREQPVVARLRRGIAPHRRVALVQDQRIAIQQHAVRVAHHHGGVDVVPARFAEDVGPESRAVALPPLDRYHEHVLAGRDHAVGSPVADITPRNRVGVLRRRAERVRRARA